MWRKEKMYYDDGEPETDEAFYHGIAIVEEMEKKEQEEANK